MTKSLKLSGILLMAAVTVGLTTDGAQAQVTMRFDAARDVGIRGWPTEQLSSMGDAGRIRALKSNQHAYIVDFDTAAMSAFLSANPGNSVSAELFIQPEHSSRGSLNGGDVGVQTVESTNDWVEGNGNNSGAKFNWDAGTSAATYFYASTSLTAGGILDTLNSLEWNDPDSGPYTFTNRNAAYADGVPLTVGGGGSGANPTPQFTNSTNFLQTDIANSGIGAYVSTSIDANIVNAMLTDVNNRGLRFGTNFGPGGVVDNSVGGDWRIYDANQDGGLFGPYMEITLTPSVGQDGDFDADLDVDGSDFLVWQRGTHTAGDLVLWQDNYGTQAPLAGVSAVPEPSSIALLVMSSALMLGRRNSRRS